MYQNLFLFQCYTIISYADMAKLTPANIVKGNDGNDWLSFSRTKSKIAVRVPFLSKATGIINELRKLEGEELLPVYPNSKHEYVVKRNNCLFVGLIRTSRRTF